MLLSAGLFLLGRVDPGCARQFRRGGRLADEALGVGGVGGVEDLGALGPDGRGVAVVDVGGGVQAEPAVAVVVVVPGEEFLAVRPGGLDRGESRGKRRPVFQGLELRFGVRVVVGDVRAGVGLGDPESASSSATSLEVTEEPRSACRLSCPRVMPCLAQVSEMSFSARTADSRVAAIQPTA